MCTPSCDSGSSSRVDNDVFDENNEYDDSLSSSSNNDSPDQSLQSIVENGSSDQSHRQYGENNIGFLFHGEIDDSSARDSSTLDCNDKDSFTSASMYDLSDDSLSLVTHTRGYVISDDSYNGSKCSE